MNRVYTIRIIISTSPSWQRQKNRPIGRLSASETWKTHTIGSTSVSASRSSEWWPCDAAQKVPEAAEDKLNDCRVMNGPECVAPRWTLVYYDFRLERFIYLYIQRVRRWRMYECEVDDYIGWWNKAGVDVLRCHWLILIQLRDIYNIQVYTENIFS